MAGSVLSTLTQFVRFLCGWLSQFVFSLTAFTIPLIYLGPSSPSCVHLGLLLHTLSKYQSHMYTQCLSAFIQSKELFMCWKCLGAVSHRERIVSTAQSRLLPSSCVWPVALGSGRHGGMCVYVYVGICMGVYHPSGVEQLFYQQKFREFPDLKFLSSQTVITYF